MVARIKLSGLKIGVISGILCGLLITLTSFYITRNINPGAEHTNNSINTSNISDKQPVLGDSTSDNDQPSNQTNTSTVQPSSQLKYAHPSSTSTQATPTTPAKPTPVKQKPTATGIEVITPDPGANQSIYIPVCILVDATPPCGFKPIPFSLVVTYSDNSTSQIPWSDASINTYVPSHDLSFMPQLLNINYTNNTLELGTYPYTWLSTRTEDAVYPIIVSYLQWSYTKYIHIYVSS